MSPIDRIRARLEGEDGAILVLAAVLLIILFALAALAVDITLKSTDRQQLWNSADAAALAGASQLPDGLAAESQAVAFALANDADLAGDIVTTFRCLVGDRNNDGVPDTGEIPGACDPGFGPLDSSWVCGDGVCVAPCDPTAGDVCNTIVLETKKTTDFAFAPAIGVEQGQTGIVSAACRGSCGAGLTGPVDLIMVIDRSGSMTNSSESPPPALNDMDQVEKASLAVLDFFDPAIQHVGLAVLPPAEKLNECNDEPESDWNEGRWLVVPLSNDYKDTLNWDSNSDGINDLDSTSELVQTIRCSTDGGWTDLGSPIRDSAGVTDEAGDDALSELLNNGRPGVKKGIILLSDGGANRPSAAANPCLFARDQAAAAKAAGIEVYTIGFGVDNPGASGRSVVCSEDETGIYGPSAGFPDGQPVTRLLADMATQPSADNCTVATTDVENTDGDYFFCLPKDENLSSVFLAVATQFAQGSRLVQLPPGS